MSSYVEVMAIVEGPTERVFSQELLVPHLASSNVFLTPVILSKPGQKGGDVKFARAKNDIELYIKQRPDTFVTFLVDFYGIRGDWPGYHQAKEQTTPNKKAETINDATLAEAERLFPGYNIETRLIPYVSMHELEALLFSDPKKLAEALGVNQKDIDEILDACGGPENIDDSQLRLHQKDSKLYRNVLRKRQWAFLSPRRLDYQRCAKHALYSTHGLEELRC